LFWCDEHGPELSPFAYQDRLACVVK
jgi:hypothetical protein